MEGQTGPRGLSERSSRHAGSDRHPSRWTRSFSPVRTDLAISQNPSHTALVQSLLLRLGRQTSFPGYANNGSSESSAWRSRMLRNSTKSSTSWSLEAGRLVIFSNSCCFNSSLPGPCLPPVPRISPIKMRRTVLRYKAVKLGQIHQYSNLQDGKIMKLKAGPCRVKSARS